jgi:murein DD-endopeptidase MepM/ murein hydrolase activator NlpD
LIIFLVAAALLLFLGIVAQFALPQTLLPTPTPADVTGTSFWTPTSRAAATGTPTMIIPGETPESSASESEVLPEQTGIPALDFVFPTPGQPPLSAWRPPLYAVPWAAAPFDHFYFIRPIGADEVNWPTPNYRYGGVFFTGITHSGVDIVADAETPVLAAAAGKIAWAGYGLNTGPEGENDPYGISVVIRHEFGFQGQILYTLYAHLSAADVVKGQLVEAGDYIGRVGETGFATGPHLHFEVRLRENFLHTTLNPELWIAPPQGWGVLAGRVTDASFIPLLSQDVWVISQDTGKSWLLQTYGSRTDVNGDPYYNENIVMGDLPAGWYTVQIPYQGANWDWDVEILPGRITYFNFRGRNGFFDRLPPTPEAAFTPPPTP